MVQVNEGIKSLDESGPIVGRFDEFDRNGMSEI